MRKTILLLALLASLGPARAEDTLTVYTYESFVSDWGPGPVVKDAFEKECACKVQWVGVEDGVALLTRLKLEGGSSKADIVLGLDQNLIAEAEDTGLFAPHGIKVEGSTLPLPWNEETFLPYDWGHFAVVYDSEKTKNPPSSLKALVEEPSNLKIVLQDPRTSTPGLGFLLWMKAVYGDKAKEAWAKLKPKVLTVTPGWSEAYGLFLDGEAPMVLSYTTSPAYHLLVEDTDRYRAIVFPEGNYMQIELAAMTATTDQPDLARQFLAFIMSPGFQEAIPQGNWMFPVIDLGDGLPEVFRDLPQPDKPLLLAPAEVGLERRAWIDEWLDAMSR